MEKKCFLFCINMKLQESDNERNNNECKIKKIISKINAFQANLINVEINIRKTEKNLNYC